MEQTTRMFSLEEEKSIKIKQVMSDVYQALSEKGYNPIGQIVGYLLSEDPTYITTHDGARVKIQSVDRDELLSELVCSYLGVCNPSDAQ
ncbi:MAG TPA: IreB family regulatory phosphoprotein [Candidatus Ruthenibacterium avium]|uniref:IreB family regulatory phosphoprotein n=1 Tax=Candidatus Ruthenibacterium avium TaxID=2838751 RepID=A0A9D2S1W6_9FIRM|nr:IreB family regulatory phosphoprotein [Candidatus Ruthenibacterium avium]